MKNLIFLIITLVTFTCACKKEPVIILNPTPDPKPVTYSKYGDFKLVKIEDASQVIVNQWMTSNYNITITDDSVYERFNDVNRYLTYYIDRNRPDYIVMESEGKYFNEWKVQKWDSLEFIQGMDNGIKFHLVKVK